MLWVEDFLRKNKQDYQNITSFITQLTTQHINKRNSTIYNMRISQDSTKKVSALITLLEDENNEVSTTAMRELLTLNERNLSSVVMNLQESSNLKLRKRVHQIQSILKIRKNRKKLSDRLISNDPSLIKGLTEIHLLWYDRDNDESLKKQIRNFLNTSKLNGLNTISKIATFMKKNNFTVAKNNELEPDSYCIGAILDTKIGSDILLCALANLIGDDEKGWAGRVVCKNKRFLLIDTKGNCTDPLTWEVEKIDNPNSLKKQDIYNVGMLLRFVIYQLLLCAMCTASYRYVYTIGKCVGDTIDKKFPSDILEKPFNGKI
jgi:hypothetical protein